MKNKKHILIISIIILVLIILTSIILNYQQKETGGLAKINYEELLNKQQNKEDFILIVTQSTCSHCATYKPKVKEIAIENNILVYYIEIDLLSNTDEFLKKFNLTGASPVTLFFKNGKEISILNRIEGDLSSTKIKETFKKMGFIE